MYYNDYLDIDEKYDDDDDNDNILDSDNVSNFFWKGKKNRKNNKLKRKKSRNRPFKHNPYNQIHTDKSTDNSDENLNLNPNIKSSLKEPEEFSDIMDLKLRLDTKQEEDIDNFLKNINSPPQYFNFDIDKFIKTKSNFMMNPIIKTAPPKTFFEFLNTVPDNKNELELLNKINTEEIIHDNYNIKNDKNNKYINRRDIITQKLKTISNKIKNSIPFYSPIDNMNENNIALKNREFNIESQLEKNEYNNDLNIDSNGVYNTVNTNQFPITNNDNELQNDFIDKFYLLNDGNIKIETPINNSTLISEINNIDLNIDLDLKEKFKDLGIP